MFGLTQTFDALSALQQTAQNKAQRFETNKSAQSFYPAINLYGAADGSLVTAELPGVKKEEVKISIHQNEVQISGKREVDHGKNETFLTERAAYEFDRTVRLSHLVDESKVEAEIKNGLLRLKLPLAESEKPKTIEVH